MSLGSSPWRIKMEGPPILNWSFPRMRESRFVPHRISPDTRFRGYDVIQVASANHPSTYFSKEFHETKQSTQKRRYYRVSNPLG
jgi:hypothetical protein